MAWFGEADHAANPPPYLTLWWIPVSNTYESMPNPVHMDTTYWWHILIPHTEYTHKYNHAGIKTWGKWLQKQHICNPAGMASHRTMASGPFVNQNILHWSHWALHVTQAQTSYINACLIFATQNHGNSLPHDAGYESNATSNTTSNATQRPKLSQEYAYMHINSGEGEGANSLTVDLCEFLCAPALHVGIAIE